MCNNHNKSNRRNFLQILGASTALPLFQSPAQILIESILMGVSQRAAALDTSVTPRRYLSISFAGAPPRWTHDHFLTPYGNTGFVANGQVGSRFEGGSTATSVSYATTLRKGLQVPTLWQFNVPRAGGGSRPMDELLDCLLNIRGILVGNPDHGAAQNLQFYPPGAAQSIPALSGDASNMPLPGVNASVSGYSFHSLKSKSPVSVSGSGNMISKLLAPFTRKDLGNFTLKRKDLSAALDASVSLLNSFAESMHPGAKVLNNSMNDAKNLLSTGFGDLSATWTTLVAKYNALVTASLNPAQSLPGINDRPITPDGTKKYQINNQIITMSDLRQMMTSSSNIAGMASQFAMAEYILTHDLSSSVAISPGGIYNLSIDGQNMGMGFDEHDTGTMVSLLTNSYYNIAYSACLLELIDQLKAKGIFQETVILSGGEFNRSARMDGTGSDHGYMGGSTTFYSGAFTGPLVLGNIYNNKAQGSDDSGTWGYGAPVSQLGKQIELSHLAATTAFLLRTSSPVTAGSSLLTTSNGVIIPTVEKGRQV